MSDKIDRNSWYGRIVWRKVMIMDAWKFATWGISVGRDLSHIIVTPYVLVGGYKRFGLHCTEQGDLSWIASNLCSGGDRLEILPIHHNAEDNFSYFWRVSGIVPEDCPKLLPFAFFQIYYSLILSNCMLYSASYWNYSYNYRYIKFEFLTKVSEDKDFCHVTPRSRVEGCQRFGGSTTFSKEFGTCRRCWITLLYSVYICLNLFVSARIEYE
jgi:hypothetical protein